MSFIETVRRARELLREEGRISLRGLKREFALDDEALEDLVEELVEIQGVALREERALAWAGQPGPPPSHPSPSSPPPSRSERDPRSYTPRHLAEKILSSKSALEGERKRVTVLFADVKGSMELAGQLDPEIWHQVLDRFFEILSEGVHRFEGTVNQYTGDGIMALFGAPIAHEDHAQRACYAALHIRDAVQGYAAELRARHGVPFGVRLGMNSGEVVVGRIGDDLRMDYTAQGHTVGLAQRMEALAESGHIILSERTARLVEGFFRMRDLGESAVKGVREPVRLFDLEGVGEFRTRLDRSRARGLSTFVGREEDMALLEAALERSRAGSGQVVGVMAPAGTGKSRLCDEFVDRCRARGVTVLVGRGVAHGKSIPMLPMLEMWRAFFEIVEDDAPEAVRAKVAGRLLLMDEGFREELPLLFDLFGVPDPANPSPTLDPEQRQKRIQGVVKRVFHDPAYRGSRVVLLEDLHWFDGASDAFLATSVESLPATADLWLVNFRPEYEARWMQRSYYHHLPLQPLDPEAIRDLLRDHLGEHASVEDLPEAIHAQTKGNPFFIEEVVQSLVESGHLVGERGDYRLTTTIEALPVPDSVQAVLAARIDRLAEREKEVLQTAAVIGKTFGEALLARVAAKVTSYAAGDLEQALSALVAAEFLFEAAIYPELELSFKHPLTQEVAAGSQLRERLEKVHAAVATALEDQGGNLEERAAEIAQHWAEAGARAAAARWSRRAAEFAGLSDPREALRHWRRVRELSAGVDDEAERGELLLHACNEIFSYGWRMGGSVEEAAEVFEEGRTLVEQAGDRPALALLTGRYGLVRYSVAGSGRDYGHYGEEAGRLAESCEEPGLRAAVGQFAAFGNWAAGNNRRALEWSECVRECAGSDGTLGKELVGFSPLASGLAAGVAARVDLGRFAEATSAGAALERVAVELGELEVLTWLRMFQGSMSYRRGLSDLTVEEARRSLEIADSLDNESSRACAYGGLGFAQLVVGEHAAARDAFREAIRISHEHGAQRATLPRMLGGLADAELAMGEARQALAYAREGAQIGEAGGCDHFEAEARISLARVLLAREGEATFSEAESTLARAEQLISRSQSRGLAPALVELRSRVAAARGEDSAAAALQQEALALYEEIGATGHVARLSREGAGPS